MVIKTVIDGSGFDGPSNGGAQEVTIEGTRRRDPNQGKIVRDEAGIKRVQEALGMDQKSRTGTMNNDTTLGLQERLARINGTGKLDAAALKGLSESTNPQDQALGKALSAVKPGILEQSYRPLKIDEMRITSKPLTPDAASPVQPATQDLARAAREQQERAQREREVAELRARDAAIKPGTPEEMKKTITDFQKKCGLEPTGKFDINTQTEMTIRASGNPGLMRELKGLNKAHEAGLIDRDGTVKDAPPEVRAGQGKPKYNSIVNAADLPPLPSAADTAPRNDAGDKPTNPAATGDKLTTGNPFSGKKLVGGEGYTTMNLPAHIELDGAAFTPGTKIIPDAGQKTIIGPATSGDAQGTNVPLSAATQAGLDSKFQALMQDVVGTFGNLLPKAAPAAPEQARPVSQITNKLEI